MGSVITWVGLAIVAWLVLRSRGGAGPMVPDAPPKPGSGGKGGGLGMSPCTPDPAAEAKFTTWLVQAIASRTGSTLLEKTPTVVIPEIAEIRAKVGAEPVELEFRGSDQYQSPDDWIANLGYWAVYPKAPVKIPSASHPCAPLWLRIRERVRDGLRARGLF